MLPSDLLESVCHDHYFPLNTQIRTKETERQYLFAIGDFGRALRHAPVIDDLTDDNMARLIRFLLNEGLAARTVNERRGRIHSLWSWIAKRGGLNRWPTTPRISEPQRTPLAWSDKEIKQLFVAASLKRGTMAGIPRWLWWTCLLSIGWDTGERIGALLLIDWTCVDLDTRWLIVPAEFRKGKRKDMQYRLSPETTANLRILKRYTLSKEKILFWPRNRCYLWQAFGQVIKEAGLPVMKRQKFHRLRRTVATYYEKAGYDAQRLMGHTTRATTDGYIDPRMVSQPQPCDVIPRPTE